MSNLLKHIVIVLFPMLVWSQSYVGYIDDYPIHLQLEFNPDNESEGRADGYYFYDSKLISIPLSGVFNNDKLTLVDGYHYFEDGLDEAKEVFKLNNNGEDLSGTLQLNDTTLKVVLTKSNQDPNKDFRDPKLSFVKDSVSTYKEKELVWFHEKYSNNSLFRLGNGFTKQQRAIFNPVLDAIHFEDAKGALDCNSWFEMFNTINLVNNKFISFTKFYSVYCGGAHPSHGNVGYTFDLNTLKVVDAIEDLYPDIDFFQLLKAEYFDETDEHQKDCGVFEDNSNWDYKTFNLTEKGVLLTPIYPHAMTPCEEDYFLSYDQISKE